MILLGQNEMDRARKILPEKGLIPSETALLGYCPVRI